MNMKRPLATYGLLVLVTGYAAFSTTEYFELKSAYETERKANDKLLEELSSVSDRKSSLELELEKVSEESSSRGETISLQKQKLEKLSSQNQYQAEELESLKTKNQELLQQIKSLKNQPAPPTETETLSSSSNSSEEKSSEAFPSMNFQATAYVATGNPTASGVMPTVGRTIATDPSIVPTGATVKITIPSHPQYNGIYVAEDTGGAINGNIIDLFVAGHAEAVSFGRQPIQLEIISMPS